MNDDTERLRNDLAAQVGRTMQQVQRAERAEAENERLRAEVEEMKRDLPYRDSLADARAENERLREALKRKASEGTYIWSEDGELLCSREHYEGVVAENKRLRTELERLSHCDADDSHCCALVENERLRADRDEWMSIAEMRGKNLEKMPLTIDNLRLRVIDLERALADQPAEEVTPIQTDP